MQATVQPSNLRIQFIFVKNKSVAEMWSRTIRVKEAEFVMNDLMLYLYMSFVLSELLEILHLISQSAHGGVSYISHTSISFALTEHDEDKSDPGLFW